MHAIIIYTALFVILLHKNTITERFLFDFLTRCPWSLCNVGHVIRSFVVHTSRNILDLEAVRCSMSV